MGLRVGHFQTLTVKTQKLVIVFEQYKKKISTLEHFVQIMTFVIFQHIVHAEAPSTF